MNIRNLHDERGVSAKPLSRTIGANVVAIQIKKGEILKEHSSKVRAVLLCVLGEAVYEDERGAKVDLYYEIEPMVKHWVKGILDSQLLLFR